MNTQGLKSFTLNCPEEANWPAAVKETWKTKPEQAAAVLIMINNDHNLDTSGIYQCLTDPEVSESTYISREAVKIGMASALESFQAWSYKEGSNTLHFDVDLSKWSKDGHPNHWFLARDAVALVLLEYGVLQAAGFSVASEER